MTEAEADVKGDDMPEGVEVKTLALSSKQSPIYWKALTDSTGLKTVSAIVSVFTKPDKYRDIMEPKSFDRTLDEFAAKGRVIPYVWSHQYNNPMSHLGAVTKAKALLPGNDLLPPDIKEFGGFWVFAEFDTDKVARKCHGLIKGNRVNEHSFAFTALERKFVEIEGIQYRSISDIDLWEVGPTMRGVHPNTAVMDVKSRSHVNGSPVPKSATLLSDDEARLRLLQL